MYSRLSLVHTPKDHQNVLSDPLFPFVYLLQLFICLHLFICLLTEPTPGRLRAPAAPAASQPASRRGRYSGVHGGDRGVPDPRGPVRLPRRLPPAPAAGSSPPTSRATTGCRRAPLTSPLSSRCWGTVCWASQPIRLKTHNQVRRSLVSIVGAWYLIVVVVVVVVVVYELCLDKQQYSLPATISQSDPDLSQPQDLDESPLPSVLSSLSHMQISADRNHTSGMPAGVATKSPISATSGDSPTPGSHSASTKSVVPSY